ncbi:histidine kinase [Fulvivirga sp. 29W222]|uniref:Histidine kinase n=1 Tax=Fulvivirga marina TaxID=2494733 RepID=A0A937FWK1_9BACT|nr:histidine kinase [Fulvivirga marina]MBL6447354.1 histidine kinase [Fulvivirga marina]
MAKNSEVQLAKKLKLDDLEETLVYFATSIISKSTEEEVLWDLAKNCISRLGFLDCVIYKVDYERDVLIQKAAHGPKNPRSYEVLQPIEIPLGAGITGAVAATGKPELIHDTSKDERYVVDDEMRLSEIAVPITQDGKVWGVIDCEHPEKHFFTDRHLKTLNAIASICAVKLARVNAEQELKLKQKALMDAERELMNLRINSLRRQMNPHFLFNALNAIQYFITADKKRLALRYHSLFSKLIRKYMLHLDEAKIQLEEEIRMINWYLKLQQLRYEDRFNYTINVPEKLYSLHIPTLIIQLVIEELIERMVMSNTGEGDLILDFTYQVGCLQFKASLEVDMLLGFTRNDPNDYRANLFTWQEHIDLLNKIKHLKILRQVDELKNDKGEVTGRTIELIIPVQE